MLYISFQSLLACYDEWQQPGWQLWVNFGSLYWLKLMTKLSIYGYITTLYSRRWRGGGVHPALYTKMYVMSVILFPLPPWVTDQLFSRSDMTLSPTTIITMPSTPPGSMDFPLLRAHQSHQSLRRKTDNMDLIGQVCQPEHRVLPRYWMKCTAGLMPNPASGAFWSNFCAWRGYTAWWHHMIGHSQQMKLP